MSGLKLTRRDDPLGAAPTAPQAQGPARAAETPARQEARDTTKREPPGEHRAGEANDAAIGGEGPYDGDRLEQTGWRFYETVKGQVQEAAQELTDAGTQVSETALAQAVIALRMPE